MKRLLALTIFLILTVGINANIESNVWELVDVVYPKNLAVNICRRLSIQSGITEHSGTNYSKVYCIWPKIFSEMNYCAADFRLNSSSEGVEESWRNCSEIEILAKLEQQSSKRSLKTIFTRIESEDRQVLDSDSNMAKIVRHSIQELNEQLDSSSSLDNDVNVKTNKLSRVEAMILQLSHHRQDEEDDCRGD
uniref:DUF3019 domain-containing protein n=1 Tax=Elaeophora elaphi TaxID=1147741 RepID=A0A0R3RNF8_9BILA